MKKLPRDLLNANEILKHILALPPEGSGEFEIEISDDQFSTINEVLKEHNISLYRDKEGHLFINKLDRLLLDQVMLSLMPPRDDIDQILDDIDNIFKSDTTEKKHPSKSRAPKRSDKVADHILEELSKEIPAVTKQKPVEKKQDPVVVKQELVEGLPITNIKSLRSLEERKDKSSDLGKQSDVFAHELERIANVIALEKELKKASQAEKEEENEMDLNNEFQNEIKEPNESEKKEKAVDHADNELQNETGLSHSDPIEKKIENKTQENIPESPSRSARVAQEIINSLIPPKPDHLRGNPKYPAFPEKEEGKVKIIEILNKYQGDKFYDEYHKMRTQKGAALLFQNINIQFNVAQERDRQIGTINLLIEKLRAEKGLNTQEKGVILYGVLEQIKTETAKQSFGSFRSRLNQMCSELQDTLKREGHIDPPDPKAAIEFSAAYTIHGSPKEFRECVKNYQESLKLNQKRDSKLV